MIDSSYLETHNVLLVTLDSLRFDVAMAADTPQLYQWFHRYGTHRRWVLTYAPATYTLPSHASMFIPGIFPENRELSGYYNRYSQSMIRTRSVEARGAREGVNFNAPSIVQGFHQQGFRTLGVGGVGWFNTATATAHHLTDLFAEFVFEDRFDEDHPDAFAHQVARIQALMDDRPTFLFVNVASTHWPYCRFSPDFDGQRAALEYVDQHISALLQAAQGPRELFAIVCSDHGEVFGLGGRGHGFYHKKVMEVPMMVLDTAEPRSPDATDEEAAHRLPTGELEQDYDRLQEEVFRRKDQADRIAWLEAENNRVMENNRRLLANQKRWHQLTLTLEKRLAAHPRLHRLAKRILKSWPRTGRGRHA